MKDMFRDLSNLGNVIQEALKPLEQLPEMMKDAEKNADKVTINEYKDGSIVKTTIIYNDSDNNK